MRFQVLHDFDASPAEDGYDVSPESNFAYVVDGCSEPHSKPEKPPFVYPGGFTGGQMISRIVKGIFSCALPSQSLESLVAMANNEIWNFQKQYRGKDVSRQDPATLANASFSFVELCKKSGEFKAIFGADVFTAWLTKSGKAGIFGGDNKPAELERQKAYADLVTLAKEDSEKVRQAKKEYFLNVFPELKRQQDNVLYAVLNGQENMTNLWNTKVVSEPVELVVILSDGAWLPTEKWDHNVSYVKEFTHRVKSDGLAKAVDWSMSFQKQGLDNNRIAKPEATAVAIFPN